MAQDGIEVKKTTEEEEGGSISNRKPRKAALARDKLYGCFVKVRLLGFILKVPCLEKAQATGVVNTF